MYLEKLAFDSCGDSSRLFNIGVPRFPVRMSISIPPDVVEAYRNRECKGFVLPLLGVGSAAKTSMQFLVGT
jgi:hypothetical protein